ncbi:hypothetical protein MKX01_028903 [Papaver californicum]|nr:hypothetical protein MKX01_028903 [Papaver californicum]
MCLKFSVLADLASVSDEQSKVVNEWLDNKIEELKTKSIELEKIKLNAEDQGDTSAPNLRDPAKKKHKGRKRSTRLKAKRPQKRTKAKPSTNPSQDIINNTPDSTVNDMAMTQESVAAPHHHILMILHISNIQKLPAVEVLVAEALEVGAFVDNIRMPLK